MFTKKTKPPRKGSTVRLRRFDAQHSALSATVDHVDPNAGSFRIDGLDDEVFTPEPGKRNHWISSNYHATRESKTGKAIDGIVDIVTDV